MNIFRLAGDMSHLASFFFLIKRLIDKKNANGAPLSIPVQCDANARFARW